MPRCIAVCIDGGSRSRQASLVHGDAPRSKDAFEVAKTTPEALLRDEAHTALLIPCEEEPTVGARLTGKLVRPRDLSFSYRVIAFHATQETRPVCLTGTQP